MIGRERSGRWQERWIHRVATGKTLVRGGTTSSRAGPTARRSAMHAARAASPAAGPAASCLTWAYALLPRALRRPPLGPLAAFLGPARGQALLPGLLFAEWMVRDAGRPRARGASAWRRPR